MSKTTAVKDYYNIVARDYDDSFYRQKGKYPTLVYRHLHILEVVDSLTFPPAARALDIGCGPGETVADLASRGFEVWGIDISKEMIAIAEDRMKEKKVSAHLSVGDIEHLEFADGQFDLIVCAGVIEYLPTDELWARELTRVLKPGGVLAINVTNPLAVRRWTHPLVEGLKGLRPVRWFMDLVKRRVLGRGGLNRFPFKPRVHKPGQFDRFVEGLGFTKITHRYFDFSFFVAPLDTVLNFITLPLKRKRERKAGRNYPLSGVGYILFARKHS